jgi:hypothetical protein
VHLTGSSAFTVEIAALKVEIERLRSLLKTVDVSVEKLKYAYQLITKLADALALRIDRVAMPLDVQHQSLIQEAREATK